MPDFKDIIVKFRADVQDLQKGLKTVEKELGDTAKEGEKQNAKWAESFQKVAKAGMALGAAGVGLAAGINTLIERNKIYETGIGRTAITTGIAREEVRKLTDQFWDASTPIEEVQEGLEQLGKTGIRTSDELKEAGDAVFMFADASGVLAGDVVNSLAPAMNAFNIPFSKFSDHMDNITYLLTTTNLDFSTLSNILEKTAVDVDSIGFSFDDLLVVIKALTEQGVSYRDAITMINDAVKAAGESTDTTKRKSTVFLETLGIAPEVLFKYTTAMDGASGKTKELADNTQSATGFSGELTVALDKLTNSAGSALAPFESLNTGLGAVSGTVMTIAGTAYLASGAMTALGISSAAAVAGIAAVALPIAAVAASLGAIALVVANGENINNWLNNTFGTSGPSEYETPYVGPTTYVDSETGQEVVLDTPVERHYRGRASGGPVSGGTPYVVGEQGPEVFVPGSSGNIIPNGAGRSQTIIIELDGRQLAKALIPYQNDRVRIKTGLMM